MSFEPAPRLPVREVAADNSPPPMPRARLSIAHLMLWTLGTAVALTVSRAELSAFELRPSAAASSQSTATYFRAVAIATAPFTGIAVAFVLVVLWQLHQRRHLLLAQPGHWILLILGVLFVLTTLGQLLRWLMPSESLDHFAFGLVIFFLYLVLLWGSIAALCWVAWRKTSKSMPWRFVLGSNFLVCVFFPIAGGLVLPATMLVPIGPVVAITIVIAAIPITVAWLVSFPIAVIHDLWLRERRDALHWAGVAVVCVNVLATVANLFAPYVWQR